MITSPFTGPRFSRWLDALRAMPSTPTAENLYGPTPDGDIRFVNLQEYFHRMSEEHPTVLIVGEAPGYLGTARTGVPFGSEYLIAGREPGIRFFNHPEQFHRLDPSDPHIYKEVTSAVMWRTINDLPRTPLLWAAYPLHPYQLGNNQSNRTPTPAEVGSCRTQLVELIELSAVKQVIALGNTAKTTLDQIGISSIKVRHPARGGAKIFVTQLRDLLQL